MAAVTQAPNVHQAEIGQAHAVPTASQHIGYLTRIRNYAASNLIQPIAQRAYAVRGSMCFAKAYPVIKWGIIIAATDTAQLLASSLIPTLNNIEKVGISAVFGSGIGFGVTYYLTQHQDPKVNVINTALRSTVLFGQACAALSINNSTEITARSLLLLGAFAFATIAYAVSFLSTIRDEQTSAISAVQAQNRIDSGI